jgi:hypothetical protein
MEKCEGNQRGKFMMIGAIMSIMPAVREFTHRHYE